MKNKYRGLFLVEERQDEKKYIAEFDFEEKYHEEHVRFVSSTIDGLVENMHEELTHLTQKSIKGQKAITIGGIEGKMKVLTPEGYTTLRPMSYHEREHLIAELNRLGVKTRKR